MARDIVIFILGLLAGVFSLILITSWGLIELDTTLYLSNLVDAGITILVASVVALFVSKELNRSSAESQRYMLAVDDLASCIVSYRGAKKDLAYRIEKDNLVVDDILPDLSMLADPVWDAYELFKNRVTSIKALSAKEMAKISDEISRIETALSDPPDGIALSEHIRYSQDSSLSSLLNLVYGCSK